MTDRITLVGNIASDPQQNTTRTGDPVTSFRLATSSRYRDEQGNWRDGEPSYYRVACFRSLAVHARESLRKGQRIVVTGTLRLKPWDNGDKHGLDAEVTADALGHDLRFGITSYTRRTGVTAAAGDDVRSAHEGSPQPVDAPPRSLDVPASAVAAPSDEALAVHWPVVEPGAARPEPAATPF